MEGDVEAVILQVCGRRESVLLREASARALTVAVEKHFDVRPPFLFADQHGRLLADDGAIAAYVATGDPVVVRLTEGVLYDFSRRVDQIRHLQWGFLADQLATVRQDKSDHGTDLKRFRMSVEEEQSARRAGDADLQRGLDALHELLTRERGAREALLVEAEARAEEAQAKLRKAVESCFAAVRKEKEDIQGLLVLEANSREEGDQKLRRELCELREAVASEEASRVRADDELLSGLQQGHIMKSTEGRTQELQGLAGTVQQLQASLNEVKLEMRNSHNNLGAQTKEAAYGGQEMLRQLEDLRRGLEREAQERKVMDANVEQLSQELARRSGDEARDRKADVERLFRLISEESDKRLDATRRMSSMVSSAEEGAGGVQLRQLEGALAESREQVRAEMAQWSSSRTDLEQKGELCAASVARLREDCKEAMQREVRARVDRERSLREEMDGRVVELRTDLGALMLHMQGDGLSNAGLHSRVPTARSSAANSVMPDLHHSARIGMAASEVSVSTHSQAPVSPFQPRTAPGGGGGCGGGGGGLGGSARRASEMWQS